MTFWQAVGVTAFGVALASPIVATLAYYHFYVDFCWRCRRRLRPRGFNKAGQGDFHYACPGCGRRRP